MTAVEKLPFQEWVSTIAAYPSTSYTQSARKNEKINSGEPVKYVSHASFKATLDEPYQKQVRVTDRDQPYYPSIDDRIFDILYDAVKNEDPSVPISKFDFENNLSMLLDAAERHYESVQCEIIYSADSDEAAGLKT